MADASGAPAEEPLALAAPGTGRAIVRASWAGTVVHLLVAGVALVVDTDAAQLAHLVVAGALFLGGVVAMAAAVVLAAGRSRTVLIGIGGLFFGAGSAPRRTALTLQGALATSTVLSIAAASVRPYTPLAFGVLVPLWPLGLLGVWCARHGAFAVRRQGS